MNADLQVLGALTQVTGPIATQSTHAIVIRADLNNANPTSTTRAFRQLAFDAWLPGAPPSAGSFSRDGQAVASAARESLIRPARF